VRGNAQGLTKRQLLPPLTAERSRALRRNAGEPERIVWAMLRKAFPVAKFRRQVPLGPYHADFCSHGARLVIEIDGDTHAGTASEERDAVRTRFLEGEGYRVIRFSNGDVMTNLDGVVAMTADHLPDALKGSLRG
jgi:very-short-patch-repair endonuclease